MPSPDRSAAQDRCTSTTRSDGIVRCQLPNEHEGGHVHEYDDGMALGWGRKQIWRPAHERHAEDIEAIRSKYAPGAGYKNPDIELLLRCIDSLLAERTP